MGDKWGHRWSCQSNPSLRSADEVLLLVWRRDQSFKGVQALSVSFQSWHAVTSRPGGLLNHTLFQSAYFNNLYAYAIIRCSRWVPLHFLLRSCLLLWLISVLPPLQKHARGAQSLSLPLTVLWRQETLGLGKGKYWWCWTQTARRLRLPRWMKWKGSWCLIHVSLLFIACFVTQTGQYDLGGGNLQTAFWKPSFSMLRSYASSPAEHCWNLNSWHWLATSQRRFSSIYLQNTCCTTDAFIPA